MGKVDAMATARRSILATFYRLVTTNLITLFGANLATISFVTIIALLAFLLSGSVHHGYIGLLLFLVLPGLFILGLLLIPFGVWRAKKSGAAPQPTDDKHPFPVLDFNNERTRALFKSVVMLTIVNVAILSIVSYEGVHYAETDMFCGTACHTPMEPQHVAFLDSPHRNTGCVECHVGPGATGFISAKLAGVRQLIEVATNSYPRPIPTPREESFQANAACLSCHDRAGDREQAFRVTTSYLDDEANTPTYTAMLLNMGTAESDSGIHGWHNHEDRTITYLPGDESLETIVAVRVTEAGGETVEYVLDGEAIPSDGEWRHMTCVDCHNRVGHPIEPAPEAIDAALASGALDPSIPYLKGVATATLDAAIEGNSNANTIGDALLAAYRESHAEVADSHAEPLKNAAESMSAIFSRHVFPDMNVTPSTYPDFGGHTYNQGCFRCHDDGHTSSTGAVISQDCAVCHNVLAWDEEEPEILQTMGLLGSD